ncbi:MAG: hypothetical protein H8K03_14370 [Nitrospira sp.]
MLTVSTPARASGIAEGQGSGLRRGLGSETWPPDVFNAVVELLSEILVQEYQSVHTTGPAPGLTFAEVQRHRPGSPEVVEA